MRRAVPALAAALLVLFSSTVAHAGLDEDLAAVENQMDALRAQIEGVRGERTAAADRVFDLDLRLNGLVADLDAARQRLTEVESEIGATEDSIDSLQVLIRDREHQVAGLHRRVGDLRSAAQVRVVQLYMTVEGSDPFLVDDVLEASLGTAYAQRVEEAALSDVAAFESLRLQEEREVERLEAERRDLEAAVARLEDARVEREAEAEVVESRAGEVSALLAEQQGVLAEIESEIWFIENEIASLAAEEERIKELIRIEQQPGGTAPGILLRPVPGGVSSGFGYRIHPIYGDRRMHTGWDMNAGCGAPIIASGSGRVFLADWKGGYGITVMIDHGGGMSTLYAHQSQVAVGYGAQVSAGDVIGYIGTTGVSTGCHLHFEVRIGGNPVDPTPYM